MGKKEAHIVYSQRHVAPAYVVCGGYEYDGNCSFAAEANRALPEIELRRMARVHAEANPGHVVDVEISDVTTYKAGD